MGDLPDMPSRIQSGHFHVGPHSVLHGLHLPPIDFLLQLLGDSFQNHYDGISQSISPLCRSPSSSHYPESTQVFLFATSFFEVLSEMNASLARRSPEILPGTSQVPTVSHQHLGLSCIHLPHHQVQVWATAFSLVCTAPMLCCCHSPRLRLSALSLPCQVWGTPMAQVLMNFLARHWALERRAHNICSGTSACPADLGPMVGAKQQCLLTQTWAGNCTSRNHTACPFTLFLHRPLATTLHILEISVWTLIVAMIFSNEKFWNTTFLCSLHLGKVCSLYSVPGALSKQIDSYSLEMRAYFSCMEQLR